MSNSQLLLEEYKELGLCWRHDDQIRSKLTAILLPLSIAALTLPYLNSAPPKLFSVFGGLMLITFWFLSSCLYMRRFNIRFSRIRKIERQLGFDSHLSYHRVINSSRWKFRHLYLIVFLMYDVFWLVVVWNSNSESAGWISGDIFDFSVRFENIVCLAVAIVIGLVAVLIRRVLETEQNDE